MNSTKSPRAALYCRVSRADQNVSMQLQALRDIARQRGWITMGEFVDLGESGAKDRRPQLDQLMREIHRGRVDVVAVWRFDRFARSVRHLVVALEDFRVRGVDFVSVSDGIDTSTIAGRFTFHVTAAVAEMERELIRDRTRAGLAAARRRGVKLGRPRIDFDVDRARQLRDEGKSFRVIARALACGETSVRRALALPPETSLEQGHESASFPHPLAAE